MRNAMNVEEWVELFREIGLDDAKMMEWHRRFEAKHPQAHRSFLEWLGLPEEEIEKIRVKSS
ncbi:MAG: hypothetical protein RBS57_20215 [Desulforhabdus sp.]|jgi:hypothetical protein|nr:hypothetical protein [Desulforhabdus sp.]